MQINLTVTAGPAKGLEFSFSEQDTFLVGRSRYAHFQVKDKYLSSIHFMMELISPRCRLIDLDSHNGTFVNGAKVTVVEARHGDQIRAGHSTFRLSLTSK
jgi:eukaryotic-like serine/threonine-protein kinase